MIGLFSIVFLAIVVSLALARVLLPEAYSRLWQRVSGFRTRERLNSEQMIAAVLIGGAATAILVNMAASKGAAAQEHQPSFSIQIAAFFFLVSGILTLIDTRTVVSFLARGHAAGLSQPRRWKIQIAVSRVVAIALIVGAVYIFFE